MSGTDLVLDLPASTGPAARHGTPVTPDAISDADSTGRAVAEPARSVFPNLLRSEWAKLRTVRSTYWSLAAALAAMVGLGAIISATQTLRTVLAKSAKKDGWVDPKRSKHVQ